MKTEKEFMKISEKYWDGDDNDLTEALEDCGDEIDGILGEVGLEDKKRVTALIIYLSEYLDKEQQEDLANYFKGSSQDFPE